MKTLTEIKQTPKGIIKADESFNQVKDKIRLPRRILYLGCGSSHFLAKLLAMVTNMHGGTGVALPCSEFLYSKEAYPIGKPELVVGISRSGETTEVLLALEKINTPKLGISAYESSLTRACDYSLVVPTIEESVVMTHSFTAFYFAYLQLLRHSYGLPLLEATEVAKATEKALEYENYIKEIVEDFDFQNVIFLGSGLLYPVALEASLKMKEMAIFWSEAYPTFEVRHGFKAIADENTLVVLMAQELFEWHKKLVNEFKGQRARVLLISNSQQEFGQDYSIEVPRLSKDATPIPYLPVVQLLSYYKAVARGLNPDNPRFLDKVVRW
ncbi:SIS domain-containing protein [Pyrococcus furiosus DSM 3638]|uniref:Glucosamine-fructose-6-phosphate aminotransferase n=3 Tax=Pyrococcus furiosus TaxID=2261 RepID=Q8U3U3_PYRFU|nr:MULTISPECIES: glucosamine-6-phosphate deaminase [Pyrococcus]AAL80486.1 glucosamine-fructose-6-phosphate aminotransferase [Pyrococcus furiosus DSM 3638]AFN03164.1 glucosamine-fructose-6-phosphate aminotransferase [Pyrococcus furiosus COM1]MDK2869967.1 hypothetical protein [Pyrococcus sp.]QEK78092.1 SIS domain-containing protein [Pyrococcus furiosus DSM 3638]